MGISESQLLSLISDLFIAGGETTITTLRWSVLCLALNPHVQERIRNEMKEVVGMDSPPSYSQREELPYFEATMYEILRFCGVVPGMWRNTTNDTTVNGFFIPKGTWVLLHFYAMSRKEEDWKDAHLFRPERFLDEQGAFQKNENFLVFSTGRRHCPGETLAKTELSPWWRIFCRNSKLPWLIVKSRLIYQMAYSELRMLRRILK